MDAIFIATVIFIHRCCTGNGYGASLFEEENNWEKRNSVYDKLGIEDPSSPLAKNHKEPRNVYQRQYEVLTIAPPITGPSVTPTRSENTYAVTGKLRCLAPCQMSAMMPSMTSCRTPPQHPAKKRQIIKVGKFGAVA